MSSDSAGYSGTATISDSTEVCNWAPFGAGDVAGGSVDILVTAGASPDAFSVRLSAPFSRLNEQLDLGEVTVVSGPTGDGQLSGASAELVAAGFAISIRFGSGSEASWPVSVTLAAEDGLP